MDSEQSTTALRSKILHRLIGVFFWACVVGFPLIIIAIVINTVAPFLDERITTKAIVTKLTFINLALILAVFQLFLGVVLALIGVTINYEVDAQAGPARLRLISASPGILLIMLANVLLIIVTLHPVTASEAIRGSPGDKTNLERSTFPSDGGEQHRVPEDIR